MGANPYRVLGVSPDADTDTITRAYRQAVKVTHPDVGGSAEEFLRVQEAYACLSDPFRRDLFDRDQRAGSTERHRPRPSEPRQANSSSYPWENTSNSRTSAPAGDNVRFSTTSRRVVRGWRSWLPNLTARRAIVVSAVTVLVSLLWTILDGAVIEGLERSFLGQAKNIVVHTTVFSLPLFILYVLVAVPVALKLYSTAQVRPSRYFILAGLALVVPWSLPLWAFLIFAGGALVVLFKMLSPDDE